MVQACRVSQGQLLYARFHSPNHHRYRETHFCITLTKLMEHGQGYQVMVRALTRILKTRV